ncbi:MAG TPA: hypothetical protein VHE55_03360 [Fimbriimonadaceae bacterium]|nr:hypothetical protein [Fimbriimonadaceae bacterium]
MLLGLFRAGKYATPLYEAGVSDPWRLPFVMDAARRELASYTGKPSDSLNATARLAGFGTRRTLIGNPIAAFDQEAAKPDALANILDRMFHGGVIRAKPPKIENVPPEVQHAAAIVLNVALQARTYRNLALSDLDDAGSAFKTIAKGTADENDVEGADAELRIYRRFRTNYMAAGAHDLLLACQEAEALLSKVPPTAKYDYRIRTVWGILELCGGSDDRHNDPDTFLLFDTGGSDTYVNCPCNNSVTNWCSIVIDTAGNDKYASDEALLTTPVNKWDGRKGGGNLPGPGGALFGYSVLIDSQGDDLYRTHRPGLGSARLGVGVLLDKGGDDQYDAYQDSEGFGMFGAGILEDDAGKDVYRGFIQVQGCGQTGGVGYLVDRSGDDQYVAEDQVIDFPSPQSAQHNVSMAQGAGNGRRADYLEGESLAGGVGILYDQAGNDIYSSAVFGQGVGYWMGVGALWDDAGNDLYNGMWYVQGAAAHFAIGYLEDQQGADGYVATMNMAQGAGHDFSIGMLLDHAGDDTYKAPNLSLGAGNANGMGVFVDFAGNDKYDSSGITLGKAAEAAAGTLRERGLCLGVFMDLGAGTDTYPAAATWAKNMVSMANWTGKAPTPAESQVGVFVDK